jgi:acyl-CoA hydrolase
VAGLIEDGCVLQTGIGGIPDAVLPFLTDRKDLGIHSELIADGVIPLIESGVITGARKNFKPRKIIVGFILGTRKIFDFVDNNPAFELHPTAYTNDPALIARNDRMIAINSALQVDLTGQVCSDSIGNQFYSGIGGQVDFLRGASRSKGGKPIIALSSTAKSGTISRIVPMLSPGAGVVTSRGLVRYVVTEHGVAYLHGKSIRERAKALIEIADPKFRAELYDYCEKTKWLQRPEAGLFNEALLNN